MIVVTIIFAVVAAGLFMAHQTTRGDSFHMLKELSTLSAEREISAEEYEFFAKLARKQGRGEDEADVKAYIGEINAEFYLGSRMEVCEPFDYAVFQYRTQAENTDRAMKKVNGQVYYGPDSFTEESYFEYIYSRLRSDILTWLVDNRDRDMERAAHRFYEAHKDQFTGIKTVTYEVTEDGVTEKKVMENTEFRTMGQSDPTLMDFLESAQVGDEKLLPDGTGRTVRKLDITTDLMPFQGQERYVVELWLVEDVLDELIHTIAGHTELVF